MTAELRDPPGVIRDANGEPVYLHLQPVIGTDGERGVVPGVEVNSNGRVVWLHAGTAWRIGTSVYQAAAGISTVVRNAFPGTVAAVSVDIGPVHHEFGTGAALDVAEMLIGGAVSAVHDAVIWKHLTGKQGMTDDAATEFMKDIETVEMMQYLNSNKREI